MLLNREKEWKKRSENDDEKNEITKMRTVERKHVGKVSR